MRAMVFTGVGHPLTLQELPCPTPNEQELLIQVSACALCRTDLHILDGELSYPRLPLVLGHQIVGVVRAVGSGVSSDYIGRRVGVPWLGASCGRCVYCHKGAENLCDQARYMGYQKNGGFAEYCCAEARFTFPIPDGYSDLQAAPLLCAGLIGFRALSKLGAVARVGFYGFGNSAQLLIQLLLRQGTEVYALTRPGDRRRQEVAKQLGAIWAGGSDELPPYPLDGAIIFASAGELIPRALRAVGKGGRVVCAGIYMSEIPAFSYDLIWHEKVLTSVANLTREDGERFFACVADRPLVTQVIPYPLEQLNEAVAATRTGKLHGLAVLVP